MRALVTGGAVRLGSRLADALARRGWDLAVHWHTSAAQAEALAAKWRSQGRAVDLFQADLGQKGGAEALVQAVGRVDLVVHSASLWLADTWQSSRSDDWEASHRLHGWTAVVLARHLAEQGSGHLVTLLDARSRDRDPHHLSYGFAKRELQQLTRFLALELAPAVRVNGLALGLALAPEGVSAAQWKALARQSAPLQTPVSVSEVVAALRYLLASPSVTGEVLVLDGGRHLKGDLFGSL